VGRGSAVGGHVDETAGRVVAVLVRAGDTLDRLHLLHDAAEVVAGVGRRVDRRAAHVRLVARHLPEAVIRVAVGADPEARPRQQAVGGIARQGRGAGGGEQAVRVVGEVGGVRAVDAPGGYSEIVVVGATHRAIDRARPALAEQERTVVGEAQRLRVRPRQRDEVLRRRVIGVGDGPAAGQYLLAQPAGAVVDVVHRLCVGAGHQVELAIQVVGVLRVGRRQPGGGRVVGGLEIDRGVVEAVRGPSRRGERGEVAAGVVGHGELAQIRKRLPQQPACRIVLEAEDPPERVGDRAQPTLGVVRVGRQPRVLPGADGDRRDPAPIVVGELHRRQCPELNLHNPPIGVERRDTLPPRWARCGQRPRRAVVHRRRREGKSGQAAFPNSQLRKINDLEAKK